MDNRNSLARTSTVWRSSSMTALNMNNAQIAAGSVARPGGSNAQMNSMIPSSNQAPHNYNGIRGRVDSLQTPQQQLRFSEVDLQSTASSVVPGYHGTSTALARPTMSIISTMSTVSDRSSSNFFVSATPLTQDPRNFADKGNQTAAMQILLEFLQKYEFDWKYKDKQLTLKDINPPSQTTLIKVYEFLMNQILGGDFTVVDKSKFHEDVKFYGSHMGYPFIHLLKKNELSAPNTNSAWPTVCGFLDWLREEAQIWVAMVGTENPAMCQVFHPTDEELDLGQVYQNAKTRFMQRAYEFVGDDERLEEVMQQQLLPQFRNDILPDQQRSLPEMEAELERAEQEIARRTEAHNKAIAEYETLEQIQDRITEVDNQVKQKQDLLKKRKQIIDDMEHQQIADYQELQNTEAENRTLEAEIAAVEEQLRRQPLKKEQYDQLVREEEEYKRGRDEKEMKLTDVDGKLENAMVVQAKSRSKLSSLNQEFSKELLEVTAACGVVELPDYTDEQDIEEYTTKVKNIVDKAISEIKNKVREVNNCMRTDDEESEKVSAEYTKIMELEKQLTDEEEELAHQHAQLDKQIVDGGSVCALEKTKQDLDRSLEESMNAVAALKDRSVVLGNTLEKKRKCLATVERCFAKNEDSRKVEMDHFRRKQQTRINHLNKYVMDFRQRLDDSKNVMNELHLSMLAAMKPKQGGEDDKQA